MLRLCLLLTVAFCAVSVRAQSPRRRAGLELFEKKIRPALIQHCYECHAEDSDDIGGELLLDSRDAVLAGGETGPAIVSGKPGDSLLMRAIEYRDLEMPPDEKLPDDVIANFRRWISMGAPDPRSQATAVAEDNVTETAVELWSLTPITDPDVPEITSAWPRIDADRFILGKLSQQGIEPNPDADPATLLRRVHFDLVGLPPSPTEVAEFISDPSDEHLAEVVDRLLSSSQFGERWGRHWLDIARYGESAGSSRDVLMPYAWRYRDYVIDSVNDDVPFDRFVTEQVAGDLLAAESPRDSGRHTIATGLLAIGSKSLNGGNLTYDVIDDQIDVISKSILGMTVSCARCHDHKFDPIPTADYYALAGIFLSTDTRYGGGTKRPKNAKEKSNVYLTLGQPVDEATAKAYQQARTRVDQLTKQVASSTKRVKALAADIPGDYRDDIEKPIADELTDDEAKQIRQYQSAKRILQQRQSDHAAASKELGPEPDYVIGVQEAGKITDASILIRGEKGQPGDTAPRGFLSAVNELTDLQPIDSDESGRRQLARWLVHPENPLTPRVAVNRIWQHLMGSGIVATVDNFGLSGLPPSHPELLDHLAHRFVHTHAWSSKAMIRELVLSRTYRQSSEMNETAYMADPDDRLRWRMPRRRLEAEQLRDAMLAVSGLLQLDRMPGSLVMKIGEGEVGRNIDTSVLEAPMNHRSVYLPIIRGIIPEQLRIFDFPEPSNVQGARDSNTTPTQSLFLMNSDFAIRVARSFADQLLTDSSLTSDSERVRAAHMRCFGVPPSEQETARVSEFVSRLQAGRSGKHKAQDPIQLAWTAYCQTLIASARFRFVD